MECFPGLFNFIIFSSQHQLTSCRKQDDLFIASLSSTSMIRMGRPYIQYKDKPSKKRMRVEGKLTKKFPWTKKAQNRWLVHWLLANILSSRNTVMKKPYPYRPNPNPKHNRALPKRKCVVNMNNTD